MEQTAKDQIIAIIADTLGADDISEITEQAEFYADLNASDEEISQIVKTIEDTLDIELSNQSSQITTVSQLLELVEEAFI